MMVEFALSESGLVFFTVQWSMLIAFTETGTAGENSGVSEARRLLSYSIRRVGQRLGWSLLGFV